MKLLLLALVAFAAAEPESDSFYGVYNPLTYGAYSGVYNPYRYTTAYSGVYNPYAFRTLGKREAESDSDSFYGIYNPLTYGAYSGVYNPYRYTTAYSGVYNPYGFRTLGKREAESDPAQIYQSGYSTVRQTGYPFGYQRVVGSEPVYKNGNFHTNLRNLNPITSAGYTYGFPYASSVYGRVFKREAESDSDSFYGVYNPYSYSGLYNRNVYSGLYNPLRYSTYGLRSYGTYY